LSDRDLLKIPIGGRDAWLLDDSVTFLNHGSFGACPVAVIERQRQYQAEMERHPIQFMMRRRPQLMDESRQTLADFVGCRREDLVFVNNATTAVNAVLTSLDLKPGDQLLTTNHIYNACLNAMHVAAKRSGAEVLVADVPFPIQSPDEVVEAVTSALTPRTRLALLDHVTSPTAIAFPVKQLVGALHETGVEVLIDGAHAPGLLPLHLGELGAEYYTGNCHKWLCAPKGAGFLHVREDKQDGMYPTVISHGLNKGRSDRSIMQELFDWVGTIDPTPWICVRDAIEFVDGLMPGGWQALARRNHELVLAARDLLCDSLGQTGPAPDEMLSAMATIALPDNLGPERLDQSTAPAPLTELQKRLYDESRIELPIFSFPGPPRQWLRVSAQAYNTLDDYERLARALIEFL
jgi:isopenicillin-N epimerase